MRRQINRPISLKSTIIDVKIRGNGGTAAERPGIRVLWRVISPKSLYVQRRIFTETQTSLVRRDTILRQMNEGMNV